MVTHGVKLDEATANRLKALGAIRDRSPHWLMRTAIERYLDAEETYEREKREDEESWQEYLLTGVSVSNDKVMHWLEVLGRGEDVPPPTP